MNKEDLDAIVPNALTEAGIRELIEMARKSLDSAERLADADAVIDTCLGMHPALYCALQYRAKWGEK